MGNWPIIFGSVNGGQRTMLKMSEDRTADQDVLSVFHEGFLRAFLRFCVQTTALRE